MQGFFTKKETQSITRPDGKTYSCIGCGLYKGAKTPYMKPWGNFKKQILLIDESPDNLSDERGKPWQGKAGRYLTHILSKQGIDIFEDCLTIHAVNCMPVDKKGGYRTATGYEIDCCRSVMNNTSIHEYQPKIIIPFGILSLTSIIGNRWKKGVDSIHKWRGFVIPDQDLKAYICPMYHPGWVEASDKHIQTIFSQDLEQAISYLPKKFKRLKSPVIHVINDLSILNKYNTDSMVDISFDYETTGIKPHATGHRIICASVAVSEDEAYVFMMPSSKHDRMPFLNLLTNPSIGKMAHNMKYEHSWTWNRLKVEVKNWRWDSMVATHILDNRPGITGLKFQTYVNFGVVDYSSEIEPYLHSGGKDGNALNKINDLLSTTTGQNQLLQYCGLDSIYQYRLARLQQELINYDDLPF